MMVPAIFPNPPSQVRLLNVPHSKFFTASIPYQKFYSVLISLGIFCWFQQNKLNYAKVQITVNCLIYSLTQEN